MTPQELKNSILQLAIQGKLVEQRPEEGTAEELYRQIQAEKQALIKAGKLKKEKPLPEITEDEIPFEIPETWKWVRIVSIVTLNPKNELPDELDTAFIPMPYVSDGYRNEHTYEIQKWGSIKKGFTHFADKDIGIAKITPCFQNRKSVIFKDLPNGHGAGTTELSIVRVIEDSLSREFLLWFFKSEYFISNGKKSFTGTAGQQRIHKDYLATCVFPLPPLAEQRRIVAKIEELLPLIDRYEQAWTRLEDFNKRFPGDMQKSLLQLAIQGKLVPQRPEEGTGKELYQKIQAEKQSLIRSGKLKKEKPLPEITDDEKPFDIPESWVWVRLASVTDMLSGFAFKSEDYRQNGLFRLLRGINLGVDCIRWNDTVYIDTVSDRMLEYKLSNGDVLLGLDRPWISDGTRVAIFDEPEETYLVQRVLRIRGLGYMSSLFIALLLHSSLLKNPLGGETTGISVPHISPNQVGNILIPLPPLAEQKRIVAKLEELLPLCDRLK